MTGTLSLYDHEGIVSLTVRLEGDVRYVRLYLTRADLATALLRQATEVPVEVQAWPTPAFYATPEPEPMETP